jgi:hypothetical protein
VVVELGIWLGDIGVGELAPFYVGTLNLNLRSIPVNSY